MGGAHVRLGSGAVTCLHLSYKKTPSVGTALDVSYNPVYITAVPQHPHTGYET